MRKSFLILLFAVFCGYVQAQIQSLPTAADSVRLVSLSNLKSSSRTMIALTLGQSNAANNGKTPYTPHNTTVFNYCAGKLYAARDPLLGTTGAGGSVWTRLGDMLIDSGLYDKVIFVPIAVGGSAIERWATGDCYQKLQQTLGALDNQQIVVTHIFWHQGETDNILNTSTAKYKEFLTAVLRTIRKSQSADFYVSLASYHPAPVTKPLGVDRAIRNAQAEFIGENKNVFEGPDTDTLIHAIHRYDSVHFSDFGLAAYARLWFNAILNKKEKIQ